jgi:hypothetical protein
MLIKIQSVTPYKDTCVVGQDSEFADMCNPEGFIYRHRWFVEACTDYGDRFIHKLHFDLESDTAFVLANRVKEKGEIDPQYWVQGYPVYGSNAWEDDDIERQGNLFYALATGNAEDIERYS